MRWSDIPWQPTTRTLRQFAGLWLIFFLILAWWLGWRSNRPELGWGLLVVAIAGGVGGLLAPALLRPIFVGWTVVAFPIGWLVSRLILAILFFLIFTPLSLVFRLMGRDALRLRRPANLDSYWQPKVQATDPRSYLRQF
jgi:hypothetical protein